MNAVRRNQRFRRPAGAVLIVLGFALLAFHVWGEVWMRRKALQLADAISDMQRPAPAEIRDTSAIVTYTIGFWSGIHLAQGAFLGTISLVLGVQLRFGGRKDRLLIHHFDLATNGQAPPGA